MPAFDFGTYPDKIRPPVKMRVADCDTNVQRTHKIIELELGKRTIHAFLETWPLELISSRLQSAE